MRKLLEKFRLASMHTKVFWMVAISMALLALFSYLYTYLWIYQRR